MTKEQVLKMVASDKSTGIDFDNKLNEMVKAVVIFAYDAGYGEGFQKGQEASAKMQSLVNSYFLNNGVVE